MDGGKSPGEARARIALIVEGARSREDATVLTELARALEKLGAEVSVLRHGLGTLAVRTLNSTLRRLRPELVITTGAVSARDTRPTLVQLGCAQVTYFWPSGKIFDIHLSRKERTEHVTRPLPPLCHAIVGTAEQKTALQAALPAERIHFFPPPGAPGAAPEASYQEHCQLLFELIGESRTGSYKKGVLRDTAAAVLSRVKSPPTAVSLCYHQVVEELRGWDLNLVVARSTLERHLRSLLAAGYEPVTVEEQARRLAASGAARSAKKTLSVSFDDGTADTLTVAAPLLRSLGVPLTAYIITDVALGRRSAPWYELIAHALLHRTARPRALEHLRTTPELAAICTTLAAAPGPQLIGAVLAAMKPLPGAQRTALADAIYADLGQATYAETHLPKYLDRAGVLALREQGAEVSSHTRSHPILPRLDDEALRSELSGSYEDLRALLGDCPGLAYPNGDSDERVEKLAKEIGYRYAVKVTPQRGAFSPLRMGRVMLSELSTLGVDGQYDESLLYYRIGRSG